MASMFEQAVEEEEDKERGMAVRRWVASVTLGSLSAVRRSVCARTRVTASLQDLRVCLGPYTSSNSVK